MTSTQPSGTHTSPSPSPSPSPLHLYDLVALCGCQQCSAVGPQTLSPQGLAGLTEPSGFGLAGHMLELARGANLTAHINWAAVPLLPNVSAFIKAGMVTGASARNWEGYGKEIKLNANLPADCQTLLSDPQTSGGLLVSCSPDTVSDVLATFKRHGFNDAAVIGKIGEAQEMRLIIE